ncbi:MAG: Arm DNA-binding domain-containing protein, partial [Burkholderiales bacterium]
MGNWRGNKVGGTSQRFFKQLSALKVDRLKTPGYYLDGGGLYLQVSPALTKSWIFRFTMNGRPREMGLGSNSILSLAEARDKATLCRKQVLDGIDPIEARKEKRQKGRFEAARAMTFADCAKAY